MAGGGPTDEAPAQRPPETLARQTFDTLALGELARRIVSGDRAALARAITLVESSRPSHRRRAQALLQELLPHTGKAHRIGITGVPGVGKSTAIDQLGINLIADGHRVAVLAVDPTSRRTGGSILGDKTRMQRLATSDHAFIRPSPTSGTLGGVARRTRETMLLVEAAGYDVVIVETVGVGQSETAVAEMVDFFLVLLLAGGGDDLQGIKKGIIEIADMVVINKADGDNATRATRSAAEYQGALGLLTPASPSWHPPVMTMSGRDNTGPRRALAEDRGASPHHDGDRRVRRPSPDPGRHLDARHARRPADGRGAQPAADRGSAWAARSGGAARPIDTGDGGGDGDGVAARRSTRRDRCAPLQPRTHDGSSHGERSLHCPADRLRALPERAGQRDVAAGAADRRGGALRFSRDRFRGSHAADRMGCRPCASRRPL